MQKISEKTFRNIFGIVKNDRAITAIFLSFALAAVAQCSRITEQDKEINSLERILGHENMELASQRKEKRNLTANNAKLRTAYQEATAQLAAQKAGNERLREKLEETKAQAQARQAATEALVAETAVGNLRFAQNLATLLSNGPNQFAQTPAQTIAEERIAELSVSYLRSRQDAAVADKALRDKLKECRKSLVNTGLGPQANVVIQAFMRTLTTPVQARTQDTMAAKIEASAAKAYNALAAQLRNRMEATARRHCNI